MTRPTAYLLAAMSVLTEFGSTEADDQIRGQGMSSLASLSEDVWNTFQCNYLSHRPGDEV